MKTRRRSVTPESPQDGITKHSYIDQLISIIDYCEGNSEVTLDDKSIKMLAIIESKFPNFSQDFNDYFTESNKHAPKPTLEQKIMYIAACLEQPDASHIAEYMKFENSLYYIFCKSAKVHEYLRRHVQPNSKLPVHDACLFQLPEEPSSPLDLLTNKYHWDLEYWRRMIMRYGVKAARLLPLASQLDNIRFNNLAGKNQNNLIGMSEIQRLHYYASKISYKNAEKNPDLAALCMKFNKTEEIYEKCLSIVKSQLKKIDLMPEVSFDGAEIDEKFAGFRMEKLAADDLRGFFLGEYTTCCQHVGGAGERCAIDGMVSPTAGFYVIYNQRNEIAVQLFAYISNDNKIIFDSWEPKAPEYNTMFEPFLEKAADIIIDAGFIGARIGVGGRTPLNNKFPRAKKPSHATNTVFPYDSHVQNIIYDRQIPREDTEASFKAYLQKHGLEYKKFAHLITNPENFNDNFIQVMRETSSEVFYLLYKFFYAHTIGPAASPASMKLTDMDTMPLYFIVAKNNDRSLDKPTHHLLANLMAEGHLGKGSLKDVILQLTNMTTPPDTAAIPRLLALSDIFNPEQPINELTVQFMDSLMREHSNLSPNDSLEDYFGTETIDLHKVICMLAITATTRLNDYVDDNRDEYENTRHIKSLVTDELIPYLPLFAEIGKILKDLVTTNDADYLYKIYKSLKSHHVNYEKTGIASTYYMSVIPGYRDIPLLLIALYNKKYEAVNALLNTFFTQDDLIKSLNMCLTSSGYQSITENYSLAETFAHNGDSEGIKCVRKSLANESDWLALLLRSNTTHTSFKVKDRLTALHLALTTNDDNEPKYECAIALIGSFNHIENLHTFLMNEDELKQKPLDLINDNNIQAHPEAVNAVAAAIRKAYANKPDLLKELAKSIKDKAFANLINRPAPKLVLSQAQPSLFSKQKHHGDKSERNKAHRFQFMKIHA